jgi:hypothetical protein
MFLPYGLIEVGDHYKGQGKCSTFGDAADVQSGQDNGIGCTAGYLNSRKRASFCRLVRTSDSSLDPTVGTWFVATRL